MTPNTTRSRLRSVLAEPSALSPSSSDSLRPQLARAMIATFWRPSLDRPTHGTGRLARVVPIAPIAPIVRR